MTDVFISITRVAPDTALVSLVVLGVLAILRGWLVPRHSVDQLIQVQAERLAEARQREQEWRAAYEKTAEARQLLDNHVGDVVDSLRTVEALVRALPPVVSHPPGATDAGRG